MGGWVGGGGWSGGGSPRKGHTQMSFCPWQKSIPKPRSAPTLVEARRGNGFPRGRGHVAHLARTRLVVPKEQKRSLIALNRTLRVQVLGEDVL